MKPKYTRVREYIKRMEAKLHKRNGEVKALKNVATTIRDTVKALREQDMAERYELLECLAEREQQIFLLSARVEKIVQARKIELAENAEYAGAKISHRGLMDGLLSADQLVFRYGVCAWILFLLLDISLIANIILYVRG